MKTCLLAVTVGIAFICLCSEAAGDDKSEESRHKQATLYKIIHDLALPNFDDKAPITDRFIMLMPGEVLDYFDYIPTSDANYTSRDPNSKPPEENLFTLSDTVPSLNPFAGVTTGKSLSTIYSNILYTIDTSYSTMDPTLKKSYTNSMAYLKERVSDPDAEIERKMVSRYALYSRYELAYVHEKQIAEKWKVGNKSSLSVAEYDDWYSVNYELLQSRVEAAYYGWLITGQKISVEEKLSIIDVKSARQIVEDSKVTLRKEQKLNSDGGNYYPVHFTPSNWYKYLLST